MFVVTFFLVVENSFAQKSCENYFKAEVRILRQFESDFKQVRNDYLTDAVQAVKAKEIALGVLNLIKAAKRGSIVHIFTPVVQMDGIGMAMLLRMVSRTWQSEGVKFKVHIYGPNSSETAIRAYAESSSIPTYSLLKSSNVEVSPDTARANTLVVAETAKGTEYISFKGSLDSSTLKNNDVIKLRAWPKEYGRLVTSSFKRDVESSQGLLTGEKALEFLGVIEVLSKQFQERIPPFKMGMTEKIQEQIERNSYEFAVQLYFEKFKKMPDVNWTTMELLDRSFELSYSTINSLGNSSAP